ncbi:MAG: hypothetical protein CM15mP80_10190 [Alphaproteobacteria bacterium]|nr:MAG: hypothetical protein CM15mP80_10190 [Alphaproteobacteria bacterium]
MFIASVINAKVHLFSGLVVGALLVAATRQMKCNCRRCEKNAILSSQHLHIMKILLFKIGRQKTRIDLEVRTSKPLLKI